MLCLRQDTASCILVLDSGGSPELNALDGQSQIDHLFPFV